MDVIVRDSEHQPQQPGEAALCLLQAAPSTTPFSPLKVDFGSRKTKKC